MIAAVVASLLVCGCRHKKNVRYPVQFELLPGLDVLPSELMAAALCWGDVDDGRGGLYADLLEEEDGFEFQLREVTPLEGVVHVAYPVGMSQSEKGEVCIEPKQGSFPLGKQMVYYGESTKGTKGTLVMKATCGVIRLHLTTPEKLEKVLIGTDDSNHYMAGDFVVSNYPFPVITPTERSVRSIEMGGRRLEKLDFTQGEDACFAVAPGCYNTFTVKMTTVDGRVCTKHLKAGNSVVVDRNRVCTVILGGPDQELVFE